MITQSKQRVDFLLAKIYLILQLLARIALSAYAMAYSQVELSELPWVFIAGFVNDLLSASWLLAFLYAGDIIFGRILQRLRPLYITLYYLFYFIAFSVLFSVLLSEVIFWDEFGTRFNFIAVDYLVYTHEIIGTLQESLPLYEIIGGIAALSLLCIFLLRHKINSIAHVKGGNLRKKIYLFLLFFVAAFTQHSFLEPAESKAQNRYARELALNGYYELFSAYRANMLNYNDLYKTIDKQEAFDLVRREIRDANFTEQSHIKRAIKGEGAKKHNVVLIVVESLSAKFLSAFGNRENITPNLDKLASESVFFTNMYAVGTRTVRGLEAITLSVPPTPGSSIIRRQDNDNLFNIGTVFKNYGYAVDFLFGGYSYFDNLENFFSNNGYRIIDRAYLKQSEISFSNIWGVADEDLFNKAIKNANKHFTQEKKFFSLIMTTSNHRPYTFPEGRIDLASGAGRSAAVKYTDYAIGKFIEDAKKEAWFDDTIFIITADHCASSAGKMDLPAQRYRIPMFIYAPKILSAQVTENVASQIDIAPTIFGILGFDYQSSFFGQDILRTNPNRAFISTYQLLGYLKNNKLALLAPQKTEEIYLLKNDSQEKINEMTSADEQIIKEAISFYQIAFEFYVNGKMKNVE